MSSEAAIGPGIPGQEATDTHEQRAFGFWLYLMSDAIIFSLLFATFAVMVNNTAGGPAGKDVFSLGSTFAETMLLLFSSLTFGLATIAMRAERRGGVLAWLIVTALLGLGFIGFEVREFVDMVEAGAGPDRSGFLTAFFTLVGTHGLHVSFGLIWILIMAGQIAVKGLSVPVVSRLSRLGLFWHFLDIVWIGIFSVVYLPGIL